MTSNGWRTVIIEDGCKLSISNGCLVIDNGTAKNTVFLEQIATILLESTRVVLNGFVLSAIMEFNIKLIICNDKHNPQGEIIPYSANYRSSSNLITQINWSEDKTKIVWGKIVSEKIKNQAAVLQIMNEETFDVLTSLSKSVLPGDINNREALAARIYFAKLFGEDFSRKHDNVINHALNYGYAILLSAVNRFISIYGYNLSLGINHHSSENPFNLSCDLMEPFRPIVDRLVFNNYARDLDFWYKREILALMYENIYYGNCRMPMIFAIEQYVKDVLSELSEDKVLIKEIDIGA